MALHRAVKTMSLTLANLCAVAHRSAVKAPCLRADGHHMPLLVALAAFHQQRHRTTGLYVSRRPTSMTNFILIRCRTSIRDIGICITIIIITIIGIVPTSILVLCIHATRQHHPTSTTDGVAASVVIPIRGNGAPVLTTTSSFGRCCGAVLLEVPGLSAAVATYLRAISLQVPGSKAVIAFYGGSRPGACGLGQWSGVMGGSPGERTRSHTRRIRLMLFFCRRR